MRAAAATSDGVQLVDVPAPVAGAGQVRARPLAAGICGSDLHLVEGYAELGEGLPPIVMGHEFCAEVEAPNGVRRVVSIPYAGAEPLGLSTVLPGAFAEEMVLDEASLLTVPDGVPDEVAALTEPLAVGVHAVAAGHLAPGDVAVVVGCGPIGLAVIASLRAAGHGPVVAADFSPARRQVAERLGADIVVDPASSSPFTRWADLGVEELPPSPLVPDDVTRFGRVVAFECVGVPGVLQQVVDGVPRHSRAVVVGVCIQPDTITPVSAVLKEVTVTFVFAYRRAEYAHALDLLATGRVDGRAFITGHVDLAGVAGAFAELREPDRHVKVIVRP